MRVGMTRRIVIGVAVCAMVGLALIPSTGLAVQESSPVQASLMVQSPGKLIAKGVAADIDLEIQCVPSAELDWLAVEVAQRFGRNVARAHGYLSGSELPDCLGFVSQTVTVRVTAYETPLKNGTALVTAQLYGYGDYGWFSITDDGEIRLRSNVK